jgi:hypothetical protein
MRNGASAGHHRPPQHHPHFHAAPLRRLPRCRCSPLRAHRPDQSPWGSAPHQPLPHTQADRGLLHTREGKDARTAPQPRAAGPPRRRAFRSPFPCLARLPLHPRTFRLQHHSRPKTHLQTLPPHRHPPRPRPPCLHYLPPHRLHSHHSRPHRLHPRHRWPVPRYCWANMRQESPSHSRPPRSSPSRSEDRDCLLIAPVPLLHLLRDRSRRSQAAQELRHLDESCRGYAHSRSRPDPRLSRPASPRHPQAHRHQ